MLVAAGTGRAADPVCALMDPEKLPQVALLEAKLLTAPGATWVERANIEAVLKEQRVQALFAPQGVGDRARLGKLLKADLLVSVRGVKGAPEPALEVAVSETAGGLRLTVRTVPVTKNDDADVAALVAAVRAGIVKHGEAVTEVVAVPPFVSNDLDLTREHLKGAYAKLAEAEALGRSGVVVVELAEAEALAKELALAAAGQKLSRPLPVYLLGEYRHDGAGEARVVTLKLSAQRGGKPVERAAELKLKPDDSPAAVRKWAAGVLDALAKDDRPRPPADPKAEAKQLADRARMFMRVGNWEEGIALGDAALLLDPTQLELRANVINALGTLVERSLPIGPNHGNMKTAELHYRLYRRSLEHLEAFIDGGGDPTKYRSAHHSFFQVLRGRPYYLNQLPNQSPAVERLRDEAREFERATCSRLLRAPLVARAPRDVHEPFLNGAISHLPVAEKLAILERMIADLPDEAGAEPRARWYAVAGFWAANKPETKGEYEGFKSRITADKFKFAAAVRDELRQLGQRPALPPPPAPAPPAPEANGVRLTRENLMGAVQRAANAQSFARLGGVLPIGPATDLIWDMTTFYLMKEKGKLVPVRGAPAAGGPSANVVFDGKYVWTSKYLSDATRSLVAFDPEGEKSWDLTKADGLPQPAPEFAKLRRTESYVISPLAPGRVCVTGFHGRAWVAVVSLDPVKGGTVKVIHEAREAPDPLKRDQWKQPDVAFTPGSARTLRGTGADGKPVTEVLIGRTRTGVPAVDRHSLAVDPETGAARVVSQQILSFSGMPAGRGVVADGALYFQEWVSSNEVPRLLRLKLPGPVVEPVAEQMPHNIWTLHVDGKRIHAVEQGWIQARGDPRPEQARWRANWWTVEAGEKRPQLIGSSLPNIQSIGASSHYGMFALVMSDDDERRIELYSVEVAAPVAKK